MTEHEAEVLARYSTPGLRKHKFDRAAKKDWLSFAYPKMSVEEVRKILDQLYGPEDAR